MDNAAIARVFGEIGDLLEIKGENPFRVRAYRNAAEAILNWPERVCSLDEAQLVKIPGVGRDLAAKIRELVETGQLRDHRDLLQEFPPTILDLLHLQGVGPKTVALLFRQLGIRTLDDLEAAARSGQLRALRGMGARKEELVLKALEERKRHEGRHLAADVLGAAQTLLAALGESAPQTELVPVGSLRRGCETCGDLDILAISASAPADQTATLMTRFTSHPNVDRVLVQGPTKSSVRLRGGLQADLRVVPADSRGAAMQYFTGSKAHNIALRDRAIQRGFKLNEYGLYRIDSGERVAGSTEEEIYAALGLAPIPPELREGRGEIAAAEAGTLPALITVEDLRGDLHTHTDATDGRDDLEAMAAAARAAGLAYMAVTDHSKAIAMANGLDEHRVLAQAARIRALNDRLDGFTILAGIECDIRPDGTMDLAEDCLAQLDLVVASVHSAFNQDESQMTDRILRALACPYVDILGHPTGRLLLRRAPYRVNIDTLVDAAARHGVALEINSQVDRLDLNDVHARLARDRGVKLVISTDAHGRAGFGLRRWGVQVARRAWLEARDVLNTRPLAELRAALRRRRGK